MSDQKQTTEAPVSWSVDKINGPLGRNRLQS